MVQMYVQSHIHRHNHHHNQHGHRHSHSHDHGHNHHNQRPQQPQPSQLKRHHHNHNVQVTSNGQKRTATASTAAVGESHDVSSLSESTTVAVASLAYVLATATTSIRSNEHQTSNEILDDRRREQPSESVRSTALAASEKLNENQHDDGIEIEVPQEDAACGRNSRKQIRRKRGFSNSDELADASDHDLGGRANERHSYRDRTRSLGSHKSLTVYDFMPRNTAGTARSEPPAAATTITRHCKPTAPPPPPSPPALGELGSGICSTSLNNPTRAEQPGRLARPSFVEATDLYHSRCKRSRPTKQEPRRALSDVSGTGLRQKLLDACQQLLRVILGSSQPPAARLASLLRPEPDRTQPISGASSISRPQKVELVRSFCMSFIGYQLETWRLLANDLVTKGPANRFQLPPLDAREPATRHHCGQPRIGRREGARAADDRQPAPELARAATIASRHHEIGGRKFHSLDRPILERQQEVVVFDEDNGEPAFSRMPANLRNQRAPVQPAVATSVGHSSQLAHTGRYEATQWVAQRSDDRIQMMVAAPASASSPINHPTMSFEQQQRQHRQQHWHAVNQHQHHHDHYHPQMPSTNFAEPCENEDSLFNVETGTFKTGRLQNSSSRKAKFYLGQHSLDCSHLQVAPAFNVRAHMNQQEPPLPKRSERFKNGGSSYVDSQNQRHRDEDSWSDRPLSDDDFITARDTYKAKSDTDSRSMMNDSNCDHYDDLQNKTNNLLPESRNLPKKRSMKKSSSPLSFEAINELPLDLAYQGARRRLGLKRKEESNQLSSISVNRSEEVIPTEVRHLSRQTTFNSLCDSGNESGSFWRGQYQFPPDPMANFVEGIGVGQMASRQALVSPSLGDIQLSLSSRRGMLEVEVIRARGLHAKAGTKSPPSPYVKVYLMKEKKCIAKCRTHQVNQTLDPLYQEPFVFRNDFKNCVLQVIVWGDYGKRDRKSMMGIVQIHLDELEISNTVVGWYKLFNIPSMTNSLASSKILRQKLVHSSSICESPLINS